MNTSCKSVIKKPEKREVRVGIGKLEGLMTESQARRYGDENMPKDLKAAGFKTFVGVSDQDLHGGLWFRVDYGKTCGIR